MLNVTTGTEIRNLLAEIMDLLDIKVNRNNKKKQQIALERKGLTCIPDADGVSYCWKAQ